MARRLDAGDLIAVDVRPTQEYEAGHITGARSIPIETLQQQLADLPTDTEVVAYCRGPYCVYADDAVRQLEASGRRAWRLEDGYPQWQHTGPPTTVGPWNSSSSYSETAPRTPQRRAILPACWPGSATR